MQNVIFVVLILLGSPLRCWFFKIVFLTCIRLDIRDPFQPGRADGLGGQVHTDPAPEPPAIYQYNVISGRISGILHHIIIELVFEERGREEKMDRLLFESTLKLIHKRFSKQEYICTAVPGWVDTGRRRKEWLDGCAASSASEVYP